MTGCPEKEVIILLGIVDLLNKLKLEIQRRHSNGNLQ
jgi:hypothetical protein